MSYDAKPTEEPKERPLNPPGDRPGWANHYCRGESGLGEWSHRLESVPSVCAYCKEPNAALLAERAERTDSGSVQVADPRPLWERILGRFFRWHPSTPELPGWARDGLMIQTRVNFSFVDRLKILCTGNVSVRTWTACENPPGNVHTQSSAVATLRSV